MQPMAREVRHGTTSDEPLSGAGAAPAELLKIFISYSRIDTKFADELVEGLKYDGGFDVMIDRQAIHEGEAWKERLGALILAADTVVFVLSPKSAASPICRWEVEEAQRKSKRILPVLAEPVGDAPVPEALAALNYVRFDEGRSFMVGLSALRRALKTDLAWLREHTRLQERAEEWDKAGRNVNRLLTGSDIAAARSWLQNHPQYAPDPTELHRDFINASDQADVDRRSTERQRSEALQRAVIRTRWALGGAVLFAVMAAIGLLEFRRESEIALQAQYDLSKTVEQLQSKEKTLAETVSELQKKQEEVVAYFNQAGRAFRDNAALKFQAILMNHKLTASDINIDPMPQLSDDQLRGLISEAGVDLIAAFEIGSQKNYEQHYSQPVVPGGASGVTIGIGYDIGYHSKAEFAADWHDLPAEQIQRLEVTAGLKGEAAQALLPQVADIVIPFEMAMTVFRQNELPRSVSETAKAFPKALKLPPNCFSALVSLVYNRGASVNGDKRKEMFAVSRLIQLDEYQAVPEQFRAMAWLWDRTIKGLPQRRAAEAELFERGLAQLVPTHQ